MRAIGAAVKQVPTRHRLLLGDARRAVLPADSVHRVLTSPPYWTLKQYRRTAGQLGDVADYDEFLDQLDAVWRTCHRALVPGGRLICVVGDVCLSRRRNSHPRAGSRPAPQSPSRDIRNARTCRISSRERSCPKAGMFVPSRPRATTSKKRSAGSPVLKRLAPAPPPVR